MKAPAPEVAYRNRAVVVLGATGFIGRWVARALTAAGAHLHVAVRDPRAAASVFSEYGVTADVATVDLEDPGDVARLMRGVRPAIVFNLAGYGVDPAERRQDTAERINAELVRDLCTLAAEFDDPAWTGLQLVHAGSALEYGRATGDLHESTPATPDTLYGTTKLAGTQTVVEACGAYGLRAATARLFTVYGPGEHPDRLLPTLHRAAAASTPIDLTAGTQLRDFTYVEDVARGLLLLGALAEVPGAVVNVATGTLTPVRDFVLEAARQLGIARDRLRFGALPTRSEEMSHRPVNTRLIRQLTGWQPATSVAVGIRRTAAFPGSDSPGGPA